MISRFLITLALTAAVAAQEIPAKRATDVKILQGPEIERADPNFAVIRWLSNNPGGTDTHYGVVHYGTDPKKLDQQAKSPIRLNRFHTETLFRVRMPELKPATTYYYTVDEEEAGGKSDKVRCAVKRFSTPAH